MIQSIVIEVHKDNAKDGTIIHKLKRMCMSTKKIEPLFRAYQGVCTHVEDERQGKAWQRYNKWFQNVFAQCFLQRVQIAQ